MVLKIISPERTLFQGEVQRVTLPGGLSPFTVLKDHAPLISTLVAGDVVYEGEKGEQHVAVEGGVVEVRENTVTVCLI